MASSFVCMLFVMLRGSPSQNSGPNTTTTVRDDASFRIVSSLAITELLKPPKTMPHVNVGFSSASSMGQGLDRGMITLRLA
eukprot:m.290111 g.290111  ORF g.290111 m.290111 type:complete len:81 (+) comp209140_c0_seq1:84-326(+)